MCLRGTGFTISQQDPARTSRASLRCENSRHLRGPGLHRLGSLTLRPQRSVEPVGVLQHSRGGRTAASRKQCVKAGSPGLPTPGCCLRRAGADSQTLGVRSRKDTHCTEALAPQRHHCAGLERRLRSKPLAVGVEGHRHSQEGGELPSTCRAPHGRHCLLSSAAGTHRMATCRSARLALFGEGWGRRRDAGRTDADPCSSQA